MNESIAEPLGASINMPVRYWLAYLPVDSFAIVMGLLGLALGWQRIAPLNYWSTWVASLLVGAAALMFVLLLVLYACKFRLYPEQVKQEFTHPAHMIFFPAVSISLLLMSVLWHTSQPTLALSLWCSGVILQLALTLHVVSQWLFNEIADLSCANPTWLIPIIGNFIIPLNGTHFGFSEISWFFFAIGLFLWIVISPLVIYKLIFHSELLSKPLQPTLFFLLAPPSVGLLAYTSLTNTLDGTARLLYYTALFFGLLLASNSLRFIRIPYSLSCWAYPFPLAVFTLASVRVANLGELYPCWWLACLLLAILSALSVWLVVNTVKTIVNS